MTLNGLKLGHPINFMKYLASVASLIFLAKTLIWNKINFPILNLMNLEELVEMSLWIVSTKKITKIPFSVWFVTA